jgi:hypothetical protein
LFKISLGEVLEVIDDSNPDWILVKGKRGNLGYAPSNYLQFN